MVLVLSLAGVCATPALGQDEPQPGNLLNRAAALFGQGDPQQPQPQEQQQQQEEATDPTKQAVKVGTFGQIDLHVKDLELTKVLQLLSIQAQRNIVASRNVAGSVSADLYGVDFYEALDAILHPNGFGYKEKGQFIFVYTAEELTQLAEQDRKAVTKIVRLNYMNAEDASTYLKSMLSNAGSIAINAKATDGFQASISNGGSESFAYAGTLVIRDYPENIQEMMDVLAQLDIRPKQVLLEATVLQARLTENNKWGVDISILAGFEFAQFMNPGSVVGDIIDGAVEPDGGAIRSGPGQVGTGESTFQLGIMEDEVAIFIEALDKVTDTTVLANPKLLVLNRMSADLLVGERLGYLSTTSTENAATQTVEFLDIGTQLSVRPFIASDDTVRMEIRPSVSDGETILAGGLVIPNERTQELVTNVIVPSGHTVVLGGLFKEDTTMTRRQVPGVGDVPIINVAFRGQEDQIERSEVIFLIKPTVMKDEALYAAGERAIESVEYARIGAREGLLPWSRSKMVSNHLRDAHTHMENGNMKRALFSTRMAMSLDKNSEEARRLHTRLTGENAAPLHTGILQASIDAMIAEQTRMNADAAELKDTRAEAPQDQASQDTKASADTRDAVEQTSDAEVIQATEDDAQAGESWDDADTTEPRDDGFAEAPQGEGEQQAEPAPIQPGDTSVEVDPDAQFEQYEQYED
jgi:type IV pilus assembly protein PilQ